MTDTTNLPDDDLARYPGDNRDIDEKVDAKLFAYAEEYVDLERQVKKLTTKKKDIREKAERLDQHPTAFRQAISVVKMFGKASRESYMSTFRRMVGILGTRQRELFPEETKRQEEKDAAAAEKAKVDASTKGPDPDTNKRSDPDAGGAKPQTPIENPAGEQAEGEAALKAGLPKTRKSQSALAAQKLADAKLN